MTYELAKQLKDAGFPQVMHYKAMGEHDGFLERDVKIDNHLIAEPTLTELIEACGDRLLALTHTPFNSVTPIPQESIPMTWMAMGGENRGTHFSYQQAGYSSEEAVAKLWLALQTK